MNNSQQPIKDLEPTDRSNYIFKSVNLTVPFLGFGASFGVALVLAGQVFHFSAKPFVT
jgi:hypothetical protein